MSVLVLKSTLVVLTAGLAALLLSRQSASLRHLVWAAGLIGAMAVPLSSRLLPSMELAVILPEAPWSAWNAGGVAVGLWVAGACLGVLVLLVGAAHLGWHAFRARPLEDERWGAIGREVAGELRMRWPVRLLQTDAVAFIGTWGILRPSVLVPSGTETWTDDRVRMVLAHELAHARRRDWPLQVLAEAARAIYWFNPLFWLLASRLRAESESAADDAVLALGVDGVDYADTLVGLTRDLGRSPRAWLPVLGMAHRSPLEARLKAVLNPSLVRLAATPWAILVVVLLAVGLTLPLAALRTSPAAPGLVPPRQTPPVPQPVPIAGSDVPELRAAASPKPEPGTPEPGFDRAAAAGPGSDCEATQSVLETPPPGSSEAAVLGQGPWFVNRERTIWIWDQPWVAGERTNVVAVRPEGTRLSVQGRSLEGNPFVLLNATMTPSGPLFFKTGGFLFPSAGCWEVTATAGDQILTFVTRVGS